MTEEEVCLVRDSWALVRPGADTALAMFYDRLFELDSRLARLFAAKDMAMQRAHLANALDLVVRHLHQPEALVRPLRDLGARHVGYGVAEGDFMTAGKALLSTLEHGLAEQWTDAHAQAWLAAWESVTAQVLIGFRAQRVA